MSAPLLAGPPGGLPRDGLRSRRWSRGRNGECRRALMPLLPADLAAPAAVAVPALLMLCLLIARSLGRGTRVQRLYMYSTA